MRGGSFPSSLHLAPLSAIECFISWISSGRGPRAAPYLASLPKPRPSATHLVVLLCAMLAMRCFSRLMPPSPVERWAGRRALPRGSLAPHLPHAHVGGVLASPVR